MAITGTVEQRGRQTEEKASLFATHTFLRIWEISDDKSGHGNVDLVQFPGTYCTGTVQSKTFRNLSHYCSFCSGLF